MKLIISSLLIVLLTGCAGPMSKEDRDAIRQIGIVSTLPDDFHLIHIGTTIFTNTYGKSTFPEWDINTYVEKTLALALEQVGRTDLGIVKGDFTIELGYWGVSGYDAIDAAASSQGFDTYVLIRPVNYDNARFHEPGFGFYDRNAFGVKRRCLYSLYAAEVRKPGASKPLAWNWGRPCFAGDEDLPFHGDMTAYSASDLETMRDRMEKRLAQKLRDNVQALGL
ncbi:MAG: hypothetical protein AAF493_27705 [Pseudomonadota bacterium]